MNAVKPEDIPPNILFHLLSKNHDDTGFEKVLKALVRIKPDIINFINKSHNTVLDVALALPQYLTKTTILIKYGAQTSQQLGHQPDLPLDTVIGYEEHDESMGNFIDNIVEIPLTNVEDIEGTAIEPKEKVLIAACAQQVGILLYKITNLGPLLFVEIGSAVRISRNLVITARHCLNDVSLDEIFVTYHKNPDGSYDDLYAFTSMEEEGISHELDYAILGMRKSIAEPGVTLIREQAEKSGTRVWIGNMQDNGKQFSTWAALTSAHYDIEDTSYISTTASSSGGGHFCIIDNNENDNKTVALYAIHAKRSKSGIFERQRSGVLLEAILAENPNSLLKNLDSNSEYPLDVNFNQAHYFDFFTTALSIFDEIEETLREDYLDETPPLKELDAKTKDLDDMTAYQVLYRWYTKNKAFYMGDIDESEPDEQFRDWRNWVVAVKIEKDNVEENPIDEMKDKKGNYKKGFEWLKYSIKDEVDHSNYAAYVELQRLIFKKDTKGIKDWEKENKIKAKYVEEPELTRAWVYLGANIVRQYKHHYEVLNMPNPADPNGRTAFNMGHKLSAVHFVLFGSKEHMEERLTAKKESPKYKNNKKLFDEKVAEYKQRYNAYKKSGYENYKNDNKDVNVDFMHESGNYKLEWARLNQIDGGDIKLRGGLYPPLPKVTPK